MNRVFTRKARIAAALAACGLCVAPVWAEADAQAPNPRKLGVAEAVQEYCKKAYPSSNSKWQLEVDRLTKGVSAETLGKVRASDAYRQARGAEANFVGQIEPVNAKRLCARPATAKKTAEAKPADESH
jgi:hypothetical protein